MAFAPCREVGGKRFSYLSHYLGSDCDEYHVLARRERNPVQDSEAYDENVHRVRMFPYYPAEGGSWIKRRLLRIWAKWLCPVDPYSGWILPAVRKGLQLCRKHDINLLVVTVPFFSALLAAVMISRLAGVKMIIDYRDPWTNHPRKYRGMFGYRTSRRVERLAIRQSDAVVLVSEVMRQRFHEAFADIAPQHVEVIYNGFETQEPSPEAEVETQPSKILTMLYAGNFYGRRQFSVIAHVLSEMRNQEAISSDGFRITLYSNLSPGDLALTHELGIQDLIDVREPVPYQQVREEMCRSDLLFLLSGDDVNYAVPFKFFDYLWARKPIFAIAPGDSMIARLMRRIDCGEVAEYGNVEAARRALSKVIHQRRDYTFAGAEAFHWEKSAGQYGALIDRVLAPAATEKQTKHSKT